MSRALLILEICLPVFALIGLGALLARRGWMSEADRAFLNKLVYYLALPALVFPEVAKQDPANFTDPALLTATFLPVLLIAALFVLLARFLALRGGLAAAFVFGSFWSNSVYMGFPLIESAFGDAGLQRAALFNAFALPLFIALGFGLIGAYGGGLAEDAGWGGRWRKIFSAPVVLAAIGGAIVAVLVQPWRDATGALELPWVLQGLLAPLATRTLKMIGATGLPLALVAIGGSLRLHAFKENVAALGLVIAGKLLLIPALAYVCFVFLFPHAAPALRGAVVLEQAMPAAVASYVIACRIGCDERFVSSMLVLGTLLSMVTIPLWLWLLLPAGS